MSANTYFCDVIRNFLADGYDIEFNHVQGRDLINIHLQKKDKHIFETYDKDIITDDRVIKAALIKLRSELEQEFKL